MRSLSLAALLLCVSGAAVYAQTRNPIQRELLVSHNVAAIKDRDLIDGALVFDELIKNTKFSTLDDNRKKLVRALVDQYVGAMREAVKKRVESGRGSKKDFRIFSLTVEWVTAPSEAEINQVVGNANKFDPSQAAGGTADQYVGLLQSELARIGLGGITRVGPVEVVEPGSEEVVQEESNFIVQDGKAMDIEAFFEPDLPVLKPGIADKIKGALAAQAKVGLTRVDIEASCALFNNKPGQSKTHFLELANARADVLKQMVKDAYGAKAPDDKIHVRIADNNPEYPGTAGPSPEEIYDRCSNGKNLPLPDGFSCTPKPHWAPGKENEFFAPFRYARIKLYTFHTETKPRIVKSVPGRYRALVVALGNMHYYNSK